MPLLATQASGSKISIGEAFVDGVMGYIIVFIGLAMLMIVVMVFSKIMENKNKTKAETQAPSAPAAPAPAAAPAAKNTKLAPGTAGEIKLYGTSPKDAAIIMAIVANQMGKPLNELRFKSIKEVK